MHIYNGGAQNYVKLCFAAFLILCAFSGASQPSYATQSNTSIQDDLNAARDQLNSATNEIEAVRDDVRLSGERLVQSIRGDIEAQKDQLTGAINENFNIDINEITEKYAPVVEAYSELSDLNARELVKTLVEGGDIPTDSLGKIADGFFNGENPFDNEDIAEIQDVVQKLGAGVAALEDIRGLSDLLSKGKLNADLLKGLADLDVDSFADLAETLDLNNLLDGINLDLDPSALIEKGLASLGLDSETLENVQGEIGALLGDVDALNNLIQNPSELFTSENLQEFAPDLFAGFESLLGTDAAVAVLSGLFSGGFLADDCPLLLCKAANQCGNCAPEIENNHIEIRNYVAQQFVYQRNWFVNDLWAEHINKALGLMTNQLTATSMQQVQIIGSFFDAKHQLETQRMFQQMTAEAHSKYHPDEQLCSIGTNTRSFANSKRRSDLATLAVSERMMARQLNNADGLSYEGTHSDLKSRVDIFIRKYCDKNGGGRSPSGTAALSLLCAETPAQLETQNADVIFTETIENKLTLDTNFIEPEVTSDEEDIFALGANLFANETMPVIVQEEISRNGEPKDIANFYYDLRSMAAKRSVAQNSYAAIVGMRAEGDPEVAPFLKALLAELQIPENTQAIEEYLGENPSLFAQEEVMMKLLYQNPEFHANLYTTPENVDRINASLLALEIIQDRNIYESLLRSEATLATMIETLALKTHRRISSDLNSLKLTERRRGGAGR